MQKIKHLIVTIIALGLISPAIAGIVSARIPVIIYDGPSENSQRKFLLGKGYPLIIIAETTEWLTVCMHDRSSGNIKRRDTRPGNNVVVLRSTKLYAEPNEDSNLVANLGRNLLLANTGDTIDGWLPVRHESGYNGFVRAIDVWGHSGC